MMETYPGGAVVSGHPAKWIVRENFRGGLKHRGAE